MSQQEGSQKFDAGFFRSILEEESEKEKEYNCNGSVLITRITGFYKLLFILEKEKWIFMLRMKFYN